MRTLVLIAVLLSIVGFAYLTLAAVADQGFSVGSAISLVVLALFVVGILGALLHPPSE